MRIPKSLKKEFKTGMDSYLKDMGRTITVVLDPYITDCPNCVHDNVRKVSGNVYDETFVRPLNIFPGTSKQRIVYPKPFNVTSVSGIQYDPADPNPKILKTTICPVCFGSGNLTAPNIICIKALVTWNPKEKIEETSAGREGDPICRIKTFQCNYPIVRDAKGIIIDGVDCLLHIAPRPKGLGADHLIEAYLIAKDVKASATTKYNEDPRINTVTNERSSDQSQISTPINPPVIPSEEGPW
jgi:hypothetical protein